MLVQGYVYIEAVKESHVTDAIKGLRIIRVSKGAKLVPEKEMVDAITISHTAKSTLGEVLFEALHIVPNPALACFLLCNFRIAQSQDSTFSIHSPHLYQRIEP